MRFGVKTHYTLLALLDMVSQKQDGPVRLQDIASRQHIPSPYLEQLFNLLKREGLVAGVRGPNGGYRLACQPENLPVKMILEAVEEPLHMTRCSQKSTVGCQGNESRCAIHGLWEELENHMQAFLASKTLADLQGVLPASRGTSCV